MTEEASKDEEQQEQVSENQEPEAQEVTLPYEMEYVATSKSKDEQGVPLWLVTFTDVMALMLTFFVLLYAMSETPEDSWNEVTQGISSKLETFDARDFNAGSQDVINIDKINTTKALNLMYLKNLIEKVLKEKTINGVIITENEKRLVISLPSELLFQSGSANINIEGKRLLFTLGEVLIRIKNNIEITGHTDPNPITGQGLFKTNWQLSLARASSVASMLKEVGYERSTTIRGLSSARFNELPKELSETERFALARRVDIVVMNHSGYRFNAFRP